MSVDTDATPLIVEARKSLQESEAKKRPAYEINRDEVVTIVRENGELEKFVERKELLQAPFEYERTGTEPGLVLIFNQESFEDKSYRLGSRRDVNEIIVCMSRLGFNVNEKYIFNDYTKEDIIKTITEIVEADLSGVNSVIVFFLTHGDSFNLLHAQDLSLRTNEIWELFGKCKHLEDKPKLFIFQACKGDSNSTITSDAAKEIELVPDTTFQSDYIGPDMLIVYSTTEGNVSFRDPKTGTWFIQELCKNFLAYGRRDDVVSLIMRTGKCLARNYYFQDKGEIKKQMPVLISTLRKKFYLNRSKDRNILIKLEKEQENMKMRLKDLEAKVDELVQEKEKRSK